MEDYLVAKFKKVKDSELGLFAIFDGHLGHDVADYLQSHLVDNIINEVTLVPFIFVAHSFSSLVKKLVVSLARLQPDFWTETEDAIRKAYQTTDSIILDKAVALGKGGSTAVTAILINGEKLVVANVGDSRAVISKNGVAKQLSVDHEPSKERKEIENKGGFVTNIPGRSFMILSIV